ncbi:MAG: cell division protein ZapA [Ruminiclostridium sp.]|nr:cell division protein ZapA [Ruminiclostridium sp.]
MDKLRVQVNGRGYYLKTDKPDEVLNFARTFEEQILYLTTKMGNVTEAEVTAYAALLLMGDSLSEKRSEADQALIDDLTARTEMLEKQAASLSERLTEHIDNEDALTEKNKALTAKVKELSDKITDLSLKQSQLARAYNESKNALNDAKSALASSEKIIERVNNEKFTEDAANDALRNELEVSRGRFEAANKQIAELNGRITKMEISSIANEADGNVSVNDEAFKKIKGEKEDLEIELAIANEELEKLRSSLKAAADNSESSKKIAEYEKTIKQLESRSGEIDKLRGLLAETEQSVRHKVDEKEAENDKLRSILKNYENSYGLSIAKKEEEIVELQQQVERLKGMLRIRNEETLGGNYIQTTFDDKIDTGRRQPDIPAVNSGGETKNQ